MENDQTYYKKKVLLSTLRQIEDVHKHEGYVVKNLWKIVALGVLLSLAIPGQGLGESDFKGKSILIIMEAEYWQVSLIIGSFYTVFIVIFHFGWKLQDYLYLKELNEKKERLIKELGLLIVDEKIN